MKNIITMPVGFLFVAMTVLFALPACSINKDVEEAIEKYERQKAKQAGAQNSRQRADEGFEKLDSEFE